MAKVESAYPRSLFGACAFPRVIYFYGVSLFTSFRYGHGSGCCCLCHWGEEGSSGLTGLFAGVQSRDWGALSLYTFFPRARAHARGREKETRTYYAIL